MPYYFLPGTKQEREEFAKTHVGMYCSGWLHDNGEITIQVGKLMGYNHKADCFYLDAGAGKNTHYGTGSDPNQVFLVQHIGYYTPVAYIRVVEHNVACECTTNKEVLNKLAKDILDG